MNIYPRVFTMMAKRDLIVLLSQSYSRIRLRGIALGLCVFALLPRPSLLAQMTPSEENSSIAKTDSFVVWNVGQGLWTTWITKDSCYHFDAGGERAPWRKIQRACGRRRNLFHFSHWDWDHIGFAISAKRKLKSICIEDMPLGPRSEKKEALLGQIDRCLPASSPCSSEFKKTLFGENSLTQATANRQSENSKRKPKKLKPKSMPPNFSSRVYLLSEKFLLPGDSTTTAEKYWAHQLKKFNIRILLLGHHGSKTSTSPLLLNELPRAKLAVVSARRARYGHPHPSVSDRLKHRGVAMVSTESWGTLIFPLSSKSKPLRSQQRNRPCTESTQIDTNYH